jgi:hypothetical protein
MSELTSACVRTMRSLSKCNEVGHHGSYNGTTKELLDAIRPKLALIGMGPHDRVGTYTAWTYGHPRADVIELIEHALSAAPQRKPVSVQVASGVKRFDAHQLTAPIFATGWDGNVRVTLFADGRIGVRTGSGQ